MYSQGHVLFRIVKCSNVPTPVLPYTYEYSTWTSQLLRTSYI